jgi:hypothetical protein
MLLALSISLSNSVTTVRSIGFSNFRHMRLLKFIPFLILILFAPPARAFSYVGGACNSTGAFNASPVTVSYSPTSGNFLVIMGGVSSSGMTLTPSATGASPTFNSVVGMTLNGTRGGQIWQIQVPSGITAIVISKSGTVSLTVCLAEYTGVAPSNPGDGTASRVTTTGAISLTPTNGDLVLYVNFEGGSFGFTTSYGTARASSTAANDSYLNDVFNSSGTQSPNSGGGDTSYVSILAAFLPAGGGGNGGAGFGGNGGLGGNGGY